MRKILFIALLLSIGLGSTAMALVDDFDVAHNYLTSGLTGFWDGFRDTGANGTIASADYSSTGYLRLESTNTYADGDATNLFLYTDVSGNFEIETVVSNYAFVDYNYGGLMVRNGAAALEDNISADWFDLFGVGNILSFNDDGVRDQTSNQGTGGANDVPAYLRIRRDGQNFYCYFSFDGINWTEYSASPLVRSDMDVPSLQVGLYHASWSANAGCNMDFDYFILRPEVAALSGSTSVDEQGSTSTTITVDLTGPTSTAPVDVVITPASVYDAEPNDILLDSVDGQITLTLAAGVMSGSFSVQAIDDGLQEGPETVVLEVTTSSTDSNYDGGYASSITIAIADNDQGTTVTDLGDGLLVDEDLTLSDTFDVWLSLPLAAAGTVTVDITTDGQTQVSPPQLVFDDTDYYVPQTVTVTGIDDAILETDPHTGTVSFSITSDDLAYAGDPFAADISATVQENECGAWSYSPYDFNTDCIVNLEDFAILASEWGECTQPYVIDCIDVRP